MRIPITESHCGFLFLLLCILPVNLCAQAAGDGRFGCFDPSIPRTELHKKPDLKFARVQKLDAIKQWQARPALVFGGFDASKYGWTEVSFYRGHAPAKGRSGHLEEGDSTDRLALAIRLSSKAGEQWFEMLPPTDLSQRGLLDIQPNVLDEQEQSGQQEQQSEQQIPKAKTNGDEMARWLALQPATPDASLPLFVLRYHSQLTGNSGIARNSHQLLLDLRSGRPEIPAAADCVDWEVTLGTCGERANRDFYHDNLHCVWQTPADDFHCKLETLFSGGVPYRRAERDFYLIADRPAKPEWLNEDVAPNLPALALRLHNYPKPLLHSSIVLGLGPTTLLARYTDMLPKTEIFLFASPGAGDMLNAHLAYVTVSADGKALDQSVPIWDIGGSERNEKELPQDVTPANARDDYRTRSLEDREGFHALQATMISHGTNGVDSRSRVHIVYWIGLETVNGEIVANAVRLASEAKTIRGCGDELEDATVSSVHIMTGIAGATVRVQPGPLSQLEEFTLENEGKSFPCEWIGVLRWKPGAGFRIHKASENCKASYRTVTISDDGSIGASPPD